MEEGERSPSERESSHQSQIQGEYRHFQSKKERKISAGKKATRVENSNYYWSDRENRSYLKFLREKVERKRQKTNLKLSKYVKTRTPTQCHTHHQKMMVKYGSIENIVAEMTLKFELMEASRSRKMATYVEVGLQQGGQPPCEEDAHKNTTCSMDLQILKEENDLQYIYY